MSDTPRDVLDRGPFEYIFNGNVAKVLDIGYTLGGDEMNEDVAMRVTGLDKRALRAVLTHLLGLKIVRVKMTPENNLIFTFQFDEDLKKLFNVAKRIHFGLLMKISCIEDLRKRSWGLV